MSARHELLDEIPPHTPEFEALDILVDAWLKHLGPEQSLAYLHTLAASLEDIDERVVKLQDGAAGARSQRLGRAWLRRSLPRWLARHG